MLFSNGTSKSLARVWPAGVLRLWFGLRYQDLGNEWAIGKELVRGQQAGVGFNSDFFLCVLRHILT